MAGQHQFAHGGLPRDGTINQPDDAAVRLTMDNCEFTEILVECDQDAFLIPGPRKNRGVTWIGRPVANPGDVVAGVTECRGCFARQARVEEQPYDAEAMGNGSNRSWPTSRRANTRQARTSSGSSHG